MTSTIGYYSLIQYCPDLSRLEAANVGVVVFAPDQRFVKALVTRDNDRVRKFFGSSDDDWEQLRSLKLTMERRFETEAPNLKTLRDFRSFVARRANELRISEPRSLKISDPETDLKNLFAELVGGRAQHTRSERRSSFATHLEASIRRSDISGLVERNVEVEVRAFDRKIIVPYGFQNGKYNLVKPVVFNQDTENGVRRTACELAVEGHSLSKHRDAKRGALQLVVIGQFSSKMRHAHHENLVSGIFGESEVELYSSTRLDDLVEKIRKTAKPVPRQNDDTEGRLL